MSLCGVGYMEGRLEMIEKAIEAGNPPGAAVLARIPKDRETGELKVSACPVFVGAILADTDPEEALSLALEEDVRTLLQATVGVYQQAHNTSQQVSAIKDKIETMLLTIFEKSIRREGEGIWPISNADLEALGETTLAMITQGRSLASRTAGLTFLIGAHKTLVQHFWGARKSLGDEQRELLKIEKALGVLNINLPHDTLRRGLIQVNADMERIRQSEESMKSGA